MEEKLSPVITVLKNGPILIESVEPISLVQSDGIVVEVKKCYLCRCGESQRKPYCDGTHKKIDFKD